MSPSIKVIISIVMFVAQWSWLTYLWITRNQ